MLPSSPPAPGRRDLGVSMNEPVSAGQFDFNRPTIVALCYLASAVTGVSALVGLVLAYIWRGERPGDWTESHFEYLINTFWISVVGGILGVILSIVLIGIPILIAVAVLTIVRVVKSLLAAQKREPMPNPKSLVV